MGGGIFPNRRLPTSRKGDRTRELQASVLRLTKRASMPDKTSQKHNFVRDNFQAEEAN